MKIVELINNLKLPISNEEDELLSKFQTANAIYKTDLTERQQVIANQLVNKDVLTRRNDHGKILFKKKIQN